MRDAATLRFGIRTPDSVYSDQTTTAIVGRHATVRFSNTLGVIVGILVLQKAGQVIYMAACGVQPVVEQSFDDLAAKAVLSRLDGLNFLQLFFACCTAVVIRFRHADLDLIDPAKLTSRLTAIGAGLFTLAFTVLYLVAMHDQWNANQNETVRNWERGTLFNQHPDVIVRAFQFIEGMVLLAGFFVAFLFVFSLASRLLVRSSQVVASVGQTFAAMLAAHISYLGALAIWRKEQRKETDFFVWPDVPDFFIALLQSTPLWVAAATGALLVLLYHEDASSHGQANDG